jgi:AcrR family transcriptional regulator
MSEAVKGARRYQSPLREEAARHTRRRIREAAAALFVEQGFVATTMKQVAAAATVAERTVYLAYPTKAALFREVVGVAIVGDELPVPVVEREEFRAAMDDPDGRRALASVARYSAGLLDRAGDLIMAGELSSGADPDMRRFSDDNSAAMASDMSAFAEALERHGSLRPGLDVDRAAGILFTLLSPHVHHLLRRHRGWTTDEYEAWLRESLVTQLLAG